MSYIPYQSNSSYRHGDEEAMGILLVNLGTPEAPTAAALKPYLKQFLSDTRVIDLKRWKWWPILNGIVLNTRPKKSAHAYSTIWTDDGSPLLLYTEELAKQLSQQLSKKMRGACHVEVGMTYGNPSIPDALKRLQEKGVRRLLVLSLYPQYSCSTTASVFDAVTKELQMWRWIPEVRFINEFHDDPLYIKAVANSIKEHQAANGKTDKLVMSFHGVPRRYLLTGDPYHCQCHKTARLVADELGLAQDEWMLTFQSRFGNEEWLQPYTDETMEALPSQGVESISICCPGFSVDCVETLEEIKGENAEIFENAGGRRFDYIPCLNTRGDHVALLTELSLRHSQGWPERDAKWSDQIEERQYQQQKAKEMGSEV